MAEDRKISAAAEKSEAAGGIGNAAAQNNTSMSFVEGNPRIAEVAKQARLVAEEKLAAYEYAHNYRKKLEREKERRMTQAKLRREEERAAAKERERHEEALRIAEALAEERLEAEKRNNRASAILEEVLASKNAPPKASEPEMPEEAALPAAEEPADEPVPEEESAPVSDEELDMGILLGDSEPDGEDEGEEDHANSEPKIYMQDDAEPVDEDDFLLELDELDELCEEREDEDSVHFDDPDSLARIEGGEPIPEPESETEASPAAAEEPEPVAKKPVRRSKRSEPREVEPLTVEDDVVALIKEQGEAVSDKSDFAQYIKRSNRAIKRLLNEIKKLERRLVGTTDDALVSEITVDIISRCAVILEIRCDNVSVGSRLGLEKPTEKLASVLASDIERYNSRADVFASLTGEQLTRVSAFLPEHLVNRTGRAVIPKLAYRETYVELEIDESGIPVATADSVATSIIAPAFTAMGLLGELYTDADGSTGSYRKKAERACKKFDSEIGALERELRKNAAAAAENQSREHAAVDKRVNAIKELDRRFSHGKGSHKKYTARLNKINSKYEVEILKVRRERELGDYYSTEKRLTAQIMSAVREKVVADLLLVSGLKRAGRRKALPAAKAALVKKLSAYNTRRESASAVLDTPITTLSSSLADSVAGSGRLPAIPRLASRRELVETVGDTSRIIGDRIKSKEHIGPIPARHSLLNNNLFDKDKTLEERALLRESVMLGVLRDASRAVSGKRSYKKYLKLSKKTARKLKRGLRQTRKAIFRAVEKNGVVTSLVETLRIQSKLAELRMLELVTAINMRARTKKAENRLYRAIEEYNKRALDYEQLSGVKLIRVSPLLPEEIVKDISRAKLPELSYKETYFEVYPKNNEGAKNYTAPETRQPDAYVPVDYKYRRITENRTAEVTEIAPPVCAEERLDKLVADTRRELRRTLWQAFLANMLLSRRLRRVLRRKKRNARRSRKFDKRLARLNKKYDSALFKLESLVPEERRDGPTYKERLERISARYERGTAKLRYRRAQAAIERRELKLSAEEFAIRREKISVFERRLSNVRSYGKPRPIKAAKADLLRVIREYNRHAGAFSGIIGEPVVEVCATIAEDILRTGKYYKLPKTVMCREIVELYGSSRRVIGDRYRYGMPVVINAQGLAVMAGTNFLVPGMGSPYVSLRSDGQPVIGVSDTGLPYAGAPDRSLTARARINPTSAVKEPMLAYMNSEDLLDNEKVITSETETAVSGEIEELDKFIGGAIKAKSRAVSSWREYRRYLRRSRKVRRKIVGIISEHRKAIKRGIRYAGVLERRAQSFDNSRAVKEALLRLDSAIETVKMHENNKSAMLAELDAARGFKNRKLRRDVENRLEVLEAALEESVKKYYREKRAAEAVEKERAELSAAVRRAHNVLSGLYIRLLSAKGRLVELGSMDLYAASRIEISGFRRMLLAFSIVGSNPKKKMHRRLFDAIDDYNDYISEDADGRGFSAVSIMLPDMIAERAGTEEIPDLIFRERFIESDDACDERITEIPTPALSYTLSENMKVTDKSEYKELMNHYKRALKEIDSRRAGVEGDMHRAQDKLDKIRAAKLRATTRYQRAAHRISKNTHSVAAYQRRIRRRLNRYRRRMYNLDRLERTPGISVKRWVKHYHGYNDKGLIYGLAGKVRAGAVALLNLERERLMLASRVYLAMINSTARSAVDYRADAKRELVSAMVRYNRAAETCSDRINEPVSRVNSMLPSIIAKNGKIPEIPEVVCSTALYEAAGEARTLVR